MVKRSSSKRAYKKRGTVRKSRVIRRRKTTQSKRKTQRGGMPKIGEFGEFRDNLKGFAGKGPDLVSGAFGTMKDQFKSRFSSSGKDETALLEQNGPSVDLSVQPSSPAPPQQTDEERKTALKNERKIARVAWTEAQNNSSNAAKAAKAAADALAKKSIPSGEDSSLVHQAYQALVQKKKDTAEAAAMASEASRTAGETAALAEKAALEGGVID